MQATLAITNTAASNVTLVFTVTNTTANVVNICKYYTPFEPICNSHVLNIVNVATGEQLPYMGEMTKRKAPQGAQCYVTIAANGGTITATMRDVSQAYQFTKGQTYTIQIASHFHHTTNVNVGHAVHQNLTINIVPQQVQFTAT